MGKLTSVLLASTMFLLGTVVGFLLVPSKGGVHCGNDNGNTNNYYGPDDVEEESMYGDEEDIPF